MKILRRVSSVLILSLLAGSGATAAPSLSELTVDTEMSLDEQSELNAQLFLLALGHQGLAGGKTGLCVDYLDGDNPQLRISVDTDRAFKVGESKLNGLDGGFDAAKMNQLLNYFQQYRVATGQANATDRLNMTITGYADPQHYENAKGIEDSIQRNRDLARDRAQTIEQQLRGDKKIANLLSTSIEGVPSAALERKYSKSNADYTKGGKNALACSTRRKVVMTADVIPADIGERASGVFRSAHRMADPELRNNVALHLNSKFKEELGKISPSLPPEARALAATQALLADPAIPEMCRKEPMVSVIALQVQGVDHAARTQKEGPALEKALKRDNLRPKGLGIRFTEKSVEAVENSADWADIHRTQIALRALVEEQIRSEKGRDATPDELKTYVSDPARAAALMSELKKGKSPGMAKAKEAVLKVTAAKGGTRNGEVWSLGTGSAAFQCFDVSKPMSNYLKGSVGKTASFRSGADLLKQNGKSGDLSVVVDPSTMHPVKPLNGKSFYYLNKANSRPILACKFCGMGVHYDEKSKSIESYDRTLGKQGESTLGNLKEFSRNPASLSFGALMNPMTYVIPSCRNCECEDVLQRIEACADASTNAQGVTKCSNGVRRLNPVDSPSSKAELKLSAKEAEQACVFTPPSFHSCGVGPDGRSDDDRQKVKPQFDFFDPVLKSYASKQAASIGDLMKTLSREWAQSCGGTVNVNAQSPQDVIDDVMCRQSGKQGFPTGDDKRDCPAL